MEEAAAAKRDLYNGFGNTLARAFEFVMIPVLFGAGGWVLDRWLDLWPLFTLLLGLFGVVGTFVKAYYEYVARMDFDQRDKPWARGSGEARGQT